LIGSTPSTCRASSAEVGGDRGAGDAGDDDGGDEGADFSDRGEDEEAAKPVEGPEQGQRVGGLEAGGAEADRHGRDQQREPAELQGKEELADELLAVGVRRADRRGDRPRGEDDQVPHLLENPACGPENPVQRCDHLLLRRVAPRKS
jgi:hypothetical protein